MKKDGVGGVSTGQAVALALATVAAAVAGLGIGGVTVVLLAMADSGGLAVPIELSGAFGGVIAGLIGATPMALRFRRKVIWLVGGGLGLVIGIVVVSLR